MPRKSSTPLIRLISKLPLIGRLVGNVLDPRPASGAPELPQPAQPLEPPTKAERPRRKARSRKPALSSQRATVPTAPACPHCKKTMIIKVARSGANAGGNFWGCPAYPQCRGMRAIFAPLPRQR